VAFGTSQSIGVYNVEFLRYFDNGATAVSFVGSLNFGLFLGAGKSIHVFVSKVQHTRQSN